jgi:hypothetical protein
MTRDKNLEAFLNTSPNQWFYSQKSQASKEYSKLPKARFKNNHMAKFRDASPRAFEHECMNKTEFFLEYFIRVNKILKEYFLTRRIKSSLTWRNILSRVHG